MIKSYAIAITAMILSTLWTANPALAAQYTRSPEGLLIKLPTTKLPPDSSDSRLRWERCYGVTRQSEYGGVTLPPDFINPSRYRPIDGDGMAWIELPFGICERLTRGSLIPRENADALNTQNLREMNAERDDGTEIDGSKDLIEQRINDFLYE